MRTHRIIVAALLVGGSLGLGVGYAEDDDGEQAARWTQAEQEMGYVVFSHSTIERLPESYVPSREAIVDTVSCELARGEFESLQIGVHAVTGELKDIQVEVESDLGVKVYHRVSPATRQKVADARQAPPEVVLERGNVVERVAEGTSVGFWLTFAAQPDTAAGLHRGKIRIQPAGQPATELDLQVRVRSFELAAPRVAFGMYFCADAYRHAIPFPEYSPMDEWLAAMYRDMAEHGQNSVTFYGGGDWSTLPPKNSRMWQTFLPLAKQAGLVHADIPCLMLSSNLANLEDEQRRAAVQWLQAECQKREWPEISIYGRDEPPYPLPGLREAWLPMRDVPMRLGTAMGAQVAYGHGDVHDIWIVFGGDVTPGMSAEAQRLGAEVWTYSFCLWRERHDPLQQRYYAGLYTWAHKLRGNLIWNYYHSVQSLVWWLRPGDDPQPMMGWETRREGIDDYRYLQMLEDCVTARRGDPLAAEAGGWLETLRGRMVTDPHKAGAGKPIAPEEYDQIRTEAATYIQRLGPVAEDQIQRRPVTGLKDEAKPFRGRPVEACIAGLRSQNVGRRRAAALALFERGPEAAPATEALAKALQDPAVRMPALRALEAIGPEAYPAVPQIAALLSHPDGFVRLGATYALSAAGPPAGEALCRALDDEFPSVVRTAATALGSLGEGAFSALPVALELLDYPEVDYPDWQYPFAALTVITAIGPRAAAAVPKLVARYEKEGGRGVEPVTLAAIGPAAAEAVPVLEKYAAEVSLGYFRPSAYYALFCIRGDSSDLEQMVNLLRRSPPAAGLDLRNDLLQRAEIVRFLNALGVKAAAVEGLVRELMESEDLADHEEGLQSFLEKVEKGEGPTVYLPT